jgi:hypothetical protein
MEPKPRTLLCVLANQSTKDLASLPTLAVETSSVLTPLEDQPVSALMLMEELIATSLPAESIQTVERIHLSSSA